MKFIHETKQRQNMRTKYHSKTIQCIITQPRMSDIGPYEACTLCIQIHWVTFADLKSFSILTNGHKISISIEPILNLTPVSIVLKCIHYCDLSLMLLASIF